MTVLRLTKEAYESYLKDPTKCIFCQHPKITLKTGISHHDGDDAPIVTQELECTGCGSAWTDVYELKYVQNLEIVTLNKKKVGVETL